jgi:hypothetical protein
MHARSGWAGAKMPIDRFLIDVELTPEQRHVLTLAYNNTLRKLHLVDRNDPVCEIVARKVNEIGSSGVTNAVALAEKVVAAFAQYQKNPEA